MLTTNNKHSWYSNANNKGNIIVIVGFLLTALFAVAGFAIDSAMYMLKRQELRMLAESVAIAAAHSLPNKHESLSSALSWYEQLRFDGQREIAPSASHSQNAIEITFNDNSSQNKENEQYKIFSINIKIKTSYIPKIFPIAKGSISVVGESSAQIAPTDIVLVVENSASLIDSVVDNKIATSATDKTSTPQIFNKMFGEQKAQLYSTQCFGNNYIDFKKGVVNLYDLLSQIGTFNVSVVATNSKTNIPFILAKPSQTTFTKEELPYDNDEPDFHQTRCLAITSDKSFRVPLNPNFLSYTQRENLLGLLNNPQNGDLSLLSNSKMLTRELLWTLPAGHSTESGYLHPKYHYSNTHQAIELANSILTSYINADNKNSRSRVIIVLTDDAGVFYENQAFKSLCNTWHKILNENNITLGILYFGHTNKYLGHSFNETLSDARFIKSLRDDCGFKQQAPFKTFWGEVLEKNLTKYNSELIPLVANGLKKVEVLR